MFNTLNEQNHIHLSIKLDARPLENLIPVDEFLPIMFDQHQNKTWKAAYPVRNLVAWSAAPLLLFPTHYTGEDGYISDTEQSDTIKVICTVYIYKLKRTI